MVQSSLLIATSCYFLLLGKKLSKGYKELVKLQEAEDD